MVHLMPGLNLKMTSSRSVVFKIKPSSGKITILSGTYLSMDWIFQLSLVKFEMKKKTSLNGLSIQSAATVGRRGVLLYISKYRNIIFDSVDK